MSTRQVTNRDIGCDKGSNLTTVLTVVLLVAHTIQQTVLDHMNIMYEVTSLQPEVNFSNVYYL